MRRLFSLLVCLSLLFAPSAFARGDLLGLTGAGGKITVAAGGGTVPVAASSSSVMNTTGSSAQAIVNKPTGTVSGDLLIAVYGALMGSFTSFTPPSGFTLIDSQNNAGYPVAGVFYKVAGGSEPSTYTFDASGTTPFEGGAIIVRVTGANASTPINAHAASLTSTGSGAYPGVTTTAANTLLFALGFNAGSSTQTGSTFPTAVPTGFTFVNSGINAGDTNYIGAAAKTQAATGATGGFTVNAPSFYFIGLTVAVAP